MVLLLANTVYVKNVVLVAMGVTNIEMSATREYKIILKSVTTDSTSQGCPSPTRGSTS